MRTRTITIKTIEAGQPRPYADSIYEAELHYSIEDGKWTPPLKVVREHARALVHEFTDSEKPMWYEDRLEVLERIGEGVWRVKIVDPFKD